MASGDVSKCDNTPTKRQAEDFSVVQIDNFNFDF